MISAPEAAGICFLKSPEALIFPILDTCRAASRCPGSRASAAAGHRRAPDCDEPKHPAPCYSFDLWLAAKTRARYSLSSIGTAT